MIRNCFKEIPLLFKFTPTDMEYWGGAACEISLSYILYTTTFILLDYTRFTITDTGLPHFTSLYNEVPGAGSVAVADAPDGALHCFVDVLTGDPRVLVTIAATIESGALVSVPGTAEGASDGCTEWFWGTLLFPKCWEEDRPKLEILQQ